MDINNRIDEFKKEKDCDSVVLFCSQYMVDKYKLNDRNDLSIGIRDYMSHNEYCLMPSYDLKRVFNISIDKSKIKGGKGNDLKLYEKYDSLKFNTNINKITLDNNSKQ
ncbi:MAG: hypothetical protein BV457_03405 [Thermoplasmata archaeon M9B1D]|nr:MAG: hypothetical protein BV457_03405 [Thermoplasmata archaeon M9B1D]